MSQDAGHRETALEAVVSPGRTLARGAVLVFLPTSFLARLHALRTSDATTLGLVLAIVLLAAACFARRNWAGPALALFGASFFLYGFHSYSVRTQIFELALTALAFVLAARVPPRAVDGSAPGGGFRAPMAFAALYALCATVSLVLLPHRVLEHRAFLEDGDLVRAVLTALPMDPLYPVAGVGRLWLYVVAVYVLVEQPDARELYRRLASGISWAAIVAVALGILDFAGLVSLAGYNQSHLFFGTGYRRLQSTFGNPSWFACFVVCALPFVLLEWREAKHRVAPALFAVGCPLAAAALFLSAARAAWLAGAVLVAAFGAMRLVARRLRRPFPPLAPLEWAALTASVAVFGLLLAGAYVRGAATEGGPPPERLEGLSREIRIRGTGLDTTSPRRVAAQYALALAKERPVLGLGYESFNMHLRAQLALPGSTISRVVNTAVAQDAAETVFDDSHNTYLQALTGMGALGLVLWLGFAIAALVSGVSTFLRDPAPTPAALVVGLLVFHLYGLFQGMAYVPVIFFLVFLEAGYVVALAAPAAGRLAPARLPLTALAVVVLAALPLQVMENGYPSLQRALGVTSYLPDESAEFEGFYRPETGPGGEFRWVARRGIVNVARAAPFHLSFTCQHPDLEQNPVVVSLRFEGQDMGSIICRQPGTQEKRFAPVSPGALRVSVSRTFRPGGSDRRELGVAVSAIRWE